MLSHEILEKLAPVFEPGRDASNNSILPPSVWPAEELIEALSHHFQKMMLLVGRIALGGDANCQAHIYQHMARTNGIVKDYSSRRIFVSFEALIRLAKDLSEWGSPKSSSASLLTDVIESLCANYDAFLLEQTPKNAFALLSDANAARDQLHAVTSTLYSVYELLSESARIDDEDDLSSLKAFSILLSAHDDFPSFVHRLNAIKRLYEEISELVGSSHTVVPLKIGKIESGSLWVKLFGESKVVALLTRFIEEGAEYLYRKFTIEGQISTIPRKIEVLDKVIGLRSSLQENGIDTAGLDDHIAKSGAIIGKDLNILLARQSSVRVNGRLTSVSNEMLKQQIESHPWPMLEHMETSELPAQSIESGEKS